jgi:hypothetical protein
METKKFFTLVITVIVLAGVVGGVFWGGATVGKSHSTGSTTQFSAGMGQLPTGVNSSSMNPSGMSTNLSGFGSMGGGMGDGITGTVSSISGNVITLTTTNGSTVQVYASNSTRIQETATLNLSDITVGESITVVGSRSQSGSVNAISIIVGSFQMTGFQTQAMP